MPRHSRELNEIHNAILTGRIKPILFAASVPAADSEVENRIKAILVGTPIDAYIPNHRKWVAS